MEVLLVINGFEINATVEEQEKIILAVASGQFSREQLTDWIDDHLDAYLP
jgi:death on curing protein